ncbi:MAG: hypothetical protein GX370_08975 [Clostridia bacterium]|nr:hypothetical protein [Clostridia bacterium]
MNLLLLSLLDSKKFKVKKYKFEGVSPDQGEAVAPKVKGVEEKTEGRTPIVKGKQSKLRGLDCFFP